MVQFDQDRLAVCCRRHAIVRLRMFGCAAKGEERPDSDVDLIAELGSGIGYFELIRAENDLAEFFGRSVDLLTEPGISLFMRDSILGSAVVVFDES